MKPSRGRRQFERWLRNGGKAGPSRRTFLQSVGAVAVGVSFGPVLAGCQQEPAGPAGEEAALNFYNWDTYVGPTTLEDFAGATGVQVNMSYFASNDELFARLRAGNPGFDVIVPSNETVTRMAQAGMLMQIDHAKIPNMANLAPDFLDAAFDPGWAHSVPYTWGLIGVGYRRSAVSEIPNSWQALFDSDEYAGRISLLGESADLCRIGAKYLGHSVIGVTPEVLAEVEAMFIRQKPHVRVFHEDNGQDLLLAGDVDLVMEYNGDIAQIMEEDDDIDFVVPMEGTLLNTDCLCIPTGAPHPDNAHAFINFILDGAVGAAISEEILYPTPNAAAREMMPDSYRTNPAIFPPADRMAASEYGTFEGPELTEAFEETMTRIRAA